MNPPFGTEAAAPAGAVLRLLVIEDEAADFRLLQRHLQRHGLEADCHQTDSLEAVDRALGEGGWDLVLIDHQLPGLSFEELLARLRRGLPEVPLILVSGTIGEELAVDLLHQGVSDFVFKDRLGRLVPAIERCLADRQRRREAEASARALADSEAFARAVVGSLRDGLFVAQDRCFVFANPALAAMLGRAHADFVGTPFEAVIAPASLPLWDQRYAERLKADLGPEESTYEVLLHHAEGQEIWAELRAARFEYRGRPAVLGVLRDTTERRRFTVELEGHRNHLEALVTERTFKAEAASRAKTAFLANMSHEIRTPLNAISGMVHLLQREETRPQQRWRLEEIDKAAGHLLSLLDDVLDLSKIESGKLALERIDFDLAGVVERCCAMVAVKAREKGLVFEVQPPPPGTWLRGDPTRLSQLLLNLLSNAVKFTDRGSIRLDCSVAPAQGGQRQLVFEVADTGIGITPEQQKQLFEPFEQGDISTTRRFGGSGLGLAICRQLATLMGGTVGVHSVPGEGSRFRFEAGLAEAPALPGGNAGAPPAAPDPLQLEACLRERFMGTRVLVAEDNLVNQIVASELLQAAGLTVDLAANGEEAVRMVREGSYALVLMDVQMPVLDGLQATRQLRALPGFAGLPIVAMTANAFGDDRAACLDAGMNDHLSKPVSAERLYELLLHWLER